MSDHNKWCSSGKEHEKYIFSLSYFHRIHLDMTDIRRIKQEIDICHMDISSGAVSKYFGGDTDIEKEYSTKFSHPRILDNIVSVAKTVEAEKL